MKNQSLILRFALIALWTSLLWLAGYCNNKLEKNNQQNDRNTEISGDAIQGPRPNITFILGEDESNKNPYYEQAAMYFRYHPQDGTEIVITHLHSLLEVRNYLNDRVPASGQPWGLVHLVVHSNEWSGMGVPVLPGQERTSVNSLQSAITSGQFTELPNHIIDDRTEFIFHACGLGRNRTLLQTISQAFGGTDDQRPVVRSARYFTQYEAGKESKADVKRYLAEYWHTIYPTRQRPSIPELSRRLAGQYPETDVDWEDALSRKQPRWPGDTYFYPFVIPVDWIVTYPNTDEKPTIQTKNQQEKWLTSQAELQNTLKKLEIPMEKFRWEFRDTAYTFADGITEPAIQATGRATILCVLRAFAEPDAERPQKLVPLSPHWTDERFYVSTN